MSDGKVEKGEARGGKVARRRFDVAPLACGRSHISS